MAVTSPRPSEAAEGSWHRYILLPAKSACGYRSLSYDACMGAFGGKNMHEQSCPRMGSDCEFQHLEGEPRVGGGAVQLGKLWTCLKHLPVCQA